jgi:hypothetical protein
VQEHDRPTAVELREEGIEAGVAQVDLLEVRQERDAVGLQGVQRMAELDERRVDVRQGQAGEEPEAAGVLAYGARAGLVHAPCPLDGIRAERHPR